MATAAETRTSSTRHSPQAIANSIFKPATRQSLRLRMAIDGPPGAGKTFTALRAATALGQRIAVINTESGAIRKYLGLSPDGTEWAFDIVEPPSYAPSTYTELILAAGREGYDVLIIDSLSHAWEGEGGALDQVDRKSDSANKFTAWKDVTPQHRRMIEAILRSPCHVIATMRTKTDYVLEPNDKGKMVPRKVGLKSVQREGLEYEFDIVCDLDVQHVMTISKTRCPDLDGLVVAKPSAITFEPLVRWLTEGSEPPADYYARTDADLRAENKVTQDRKPPEQRRAEAAAAQRAAMAGGNGNGQHAAQAATPATEEVDPTKTPITQASVLRIGQLLQTSTMSMTEFMFKVLPKYPPATSVGQLTELQAKQVIGTLLANQMAVMEKEEPPFTVPLAAPPADDAIGMDGSPTPFDGLAVEAGTITAEQLAKLQPLVKASGWPMDGQQQYLARRKVGSFRGLSEFDAAELVNQLEGLVNAKAGGTSAAGDQPPAGTSAAASKN